MTTTPRFAAIFTAVKICGRRCKIPGLALLLASLPTIAAAQSDGATTIDLVWTEVFDRTKPNPRVGIQTRKTMTITLQGEKEITQTMESRAGRFNRSSSSTTQLGGGWRVASENVLVRTEEYPHHARVMTVTVDGRLCSLTVVHQLKAGQSIYLHPMLSRPGQTGTYSKIATQSASCAIR